VEFLSHVWHLVDIDLDEVCVGELIGVLHDLRSDHFARAAPGGETVDYDDVVLEGFIELGLAWGLLASARVEKEIMRRDLPGNVVDTHFASCG
jgi:hypothetical protein